MKTILSILCSFALLAVFSPAFGQQNSLFNTYAFDLMQLNVAATGSRPVEINLNYRSQWVSAKDNPTTLQLDASFALGKNTGLGVKLKQQNLGLLSFTSLTGAYSYKVRFNKTTFIQLGAGFSWQLNNFRSDAAMVVDQSDVTLYSSLNKVNNFDAEAGAIFNTKRLKIGVSGNNVYNTNGASNQFAYTIKPQLNSFATYKVVESERWSIDPWLVHRINFGGHQQVEGMVNATFNKAFILGTGYRSSYGIIALAGIQKGNFRVIYSYDYYAASQKTNYGSSHQVMLSYVVNDRKKQPVIETPKVTEPVVVKEPEVKEPEAVEPIVDKVPEPKVEPEPIKQPEPPKLSEDQIIAQKVDSINELSEQLIFENGKTVLATDKDLLLNEVASILKSHPTLLVDLEGYASKDGSAELNKKLSEQRALYVKNELIKRGVKPSQFHAIRAIGASNISQTNNDNFNRTVRFKSVKQ